ncbi:hypothetical protein K491DRAFT_715297 [Lophiostoma macrostomum CBS 122681]|uniref:Uncharacterized protein n=1 Tax=Lophiostoma macrostomum CBS 122681 TaxID=1314788 RepID=A0A6A6TD22_9PLEO|nr:hypothetical protein K491DRAFT_715297 [Lophiostoma macrostomum CBS 122681]
MSSRDDSDATELPDIPREDARGSGQQQNPQIGDRRPSRPIAGTLGESSEQHVAISQQDEHRAHLPQQANLTPTQIFQNHQSQVIQQQQQQILHQPSQVLPGYDPNRPGVSERRRRTHQSRVPAGASQSRGRSPSFTASSSSTTSKSNTSALMALLEGRSSTRHVASSGSLPPARSQSAGSSSSASEPLAGRRLPPLRVETDFRTVDTVYAKLSRELRIIEELEELLNEFEDDADPDTMPSLQLSARPDTRIFDTPTSTLVDDDFRETIYHPPGCCLCSQCRPRGRILPEGDAASDFPTEDMAQMQERSRHLLPPRLPPAVHPICQRCGARHDVTTVCPNPQAPYVTPYPLIPTPARGLPTVQYYAPRPPLQSGSDSQWSNSQMTAAPDQVPPTGGYYYHPQGPLVTQQEWRTANTQEAAGPRVRRRALGPPVDGNVSQPSVIAPARPQAPGPPFERHASQASQGHMWPADAFVAQNIQGGAAQLSQTQALDPVYGRNILQLPSMNAMIRGENFAPGLQHMPYQPVQAQAPAFQTSHPTAFQWSGNEFVPQRHRHEVTQPPPRVPAPGPLHERNDAQRRAMSNHEVFAQQLQRQRQRQSEQLARTAAPYPPPMPANPHAPAHGAFHQRNSQVFEQQLQLQRQHQSEQLARTSTPYPPPMPSDPYAPAHGSMPSTSHPPWRPASSHDYFEREAQRREEQMARGRASYHPHMNYNRSWGGQQPALDHGGMHTPLGVPHSGDVHSGMRQTDQTALVPYTAGRSGGMQRPEAYDPNLTERHVGSRPRTEHRGRRREGEETEGEGRSRLERGWDGKGKGKGKE